MPEDPVETKLVEEVDLLNLNSLPPGTSILNPSVSSSNFDLLSDLGGSASPTPFESFMASTTKQPPTNAENLFDPFSSQGTNDLFKTLGSELNFVGDVKSNKGKSVASQTRSLYVLSCLAPPTTPQAPPTTPLHQAKSPISGPDYSRTHFDTAFGNKTEQPKVPNSKGKFDVFGDLLGSQGYEFSSQKDSAPKTINDMRKTEMARDMDPDKLRILEWVSETGLR